MVYRSLRLNGGQLGGAGARAAGRRDPLCVSLRAGAANDLCIERSWPLTPHDARLAARVGKQRPQSINDAHRTPVLPARLQCASVCAICFTVVDLLLL